MPLECVTPEYHYINAKVDIVAVPAIGADPRVAYRYPGQKPPEKQNAERWHHIFSDLPDARVFLYTFSKPETPKNHGITKYASELLQDMVQEGLGKSRMIHFVGHSTGGLVVKRALVIANGSNNVDILDIKRNCCSIAFFGTPHYGSTVLCQGTYKWAVKRLLCLKAPMSERLREDLSDVENLDSLVHFSRVFQPLTINMEKIWSFYEARDSKLEVRATINDRTGSTAIRRMVVEKRCAMLNASDDYPFIGCEQAISVKGDHASLPRFGDDPNSSTFHQYIDGLRDHISQMSGKIERDPRWLERELKVEVHLFYELNEEKQSTIKLWSVTPFLRGLINDGPGACLERRVELAVKDASNDDGEEDGPSRTHTPSRRRGASTSNDTPPRLHSGSTLVGPGNHNGHSPTLLTTNLGEATDGDADETESNNSTPSTYKLPDLGHSHFRWIHVPANNMIWVEKIFQSVERDRERKRFAEAAESIQGVEGQSEMATSPESEDGTCFTPSEKQIGLLEDPARAQLLKAAEIIDRHDKPVDAPGLKAAIADPQKGAALIKVAQSVPAPKSPAIIPEAAQTIDDIRERAVFLEVTKDNLRRGETVQTETIAKAIRDERKKPGLGSAVLDKHYWNRKQVNSRHGLPHGRYMQPFCQLFLPHSRSDSGLNMRATMVHVDAMASPIDSPQLCVYFPYLHWDTFAGLQKRNELVLQRLKDPRLYPMNSDVEKGPSMENKLIWQYLLDSSNLPLHIRRSLDQFGNPHLQNISVRDRDQVMYKCTKPESPLISTNPRDDNAHCFSIPSNFRAKSDAEAKVLMVDQLWAWVIDSKTVTTFFAPKEEFPPPKGPAPESSNESEHSSLLTAKTFLGQADLRNEIYDDVNGDQRFASQCRDPFDFVALAIWHAVIVFLERSTDPDLKLFTLFQEWICELAEEQGASFKVFQQIQGETTRIFKESKNRDAADPEFRNIVEKLDPSSDLNALIQLKDVQDELGMITRLFSRQAEVIDNLIHDYKILDGESKAHAKSIGWLDEAKNRYIHSYQNEINDLMTSAKVTIEDYMSLLDMKQKQSNVVEAYISRMTAQTSGEQNRSIMIFTIFTIIFLPLSFFTSFFGMNVQDWSGSSSNKRLPTVLALMCGISAAVIIVALFLAFTRHPYEKIKKAPETVKKTHHHFKRLWDCWHWWGGKRVEEIDGADEVKGTKRNRSILDLEGGFQSEGVQGMRWRRGSVS
ncbi:cora-like Mg2+ transporter protein-domain-containing protein [Clohesyomyces aquaticus]|uniref:Cora-like Mg2+ transporter protein-domain-containing protein n=1 Tax=Clohesyomyces aquaticus TaxID=1231657 RepID=A0A1Y2A4Q2_9PLEO|nr:cora-like Mg2+ transporter protein-domain-containing protein [Clohesyomyces aquaticus]